jgi:hypothetical protein
MPVKELVNKAINEAVDAAVFINLVGELGPHIDKAAANARMPVDEAINKAAESTRMLANKAINEAVDAAVFVESGGELGHSSTRPLQPPECWSRRPWTQLCSLILWGLTRPSMRLLQVPK